MPEAEALITLSAAIASRDRARLRAALLRAKEEADPVAVDEILLQSHLFVGFPIALNAFVLWREIGGTVAEPMGEGDAVEWASRGERVCAEVYGRNYRRLRDRVAALHPALDRWMAETGYGRVIGRPRVDLRTRELCIVALLAVWDTPDQLHSHLRGALNAGATAAEVERALDLAAEHVDADSALRNRELWNVILARPHPAGPHPAA
jgi:4-carboxymuconolactone decarboxylase